MTQARADERLASMTPGTRTEAPMRGSERLWSLQWTTRTIGELLVGPARMEDALGFIGESYAALFPVAPGRFLEETMTPAKRRFLEETDALIVRDGARPVGVFLGHPLDWSTYYVRTLAILPSLRQRGFMREFVSSYVAGTLRNAGVDRLEADTAPNNFVMHRSFARAGWVVTGTSNSERWGALVRYTMFLTPEPEGCFQRQFIAVPAAPEQGTAS